MRTSPPSDHATARAARAAIQALDAETIAEQLAIVAIPAPPHEETARGDHLERRFREIGLERVERDAVGNVVGWLGGGGDGAPPVVVSAHLDTVFGPEVSVVPRVEGSRLFAPGITDNARGLAAMITLARAMRSHPPPLERPVAFVGTVGEEGDGDLRGAKHLFGRGGRFEEAACSVSLDGSGLRRIVNRGVGARRLRITVRGPGGHSWSDWGAPNAVAAAGAAVSALSRQPLPSEPRTTLTVARIGGGSSINAIPESAWFEVDIRSESSDVLSRIDRVCSAAVDRAVADENARRRPGTPALESTREVIGDRPAGATPADHPLVLAAVRVTRLVGARPELAASSTDSNIPMSRGIPAVTLGAGGESGGVHTLGEWYENRGGTLGIERALLLVLEMGCTPGAVPG